MQRITWIFQSAVFLLVAACDTPAAADPPPQKPSAPRETVLIDGVPHIEQKPDFCGEACVAMVLGKLGHGGDQDWVFDQSGLDPALGRGVYTKELLTALDTIGFETPHPYTRATTGEEVHAAFFAMLADLRAGVPSIVCMHYDDAPRTTEHFRLVLGYDPTRDEVIYHEPAEADGAYKRMGRSLFEKLWPLGPAGRHVVIRMPLRAADLKPGRASDTPTDADFAAHIIALKETLPRGLHIVIRKPFVVIGNESMGRVRHHATGTIDSAVKRLKKAYFTKDPSSIIDVWLFGDDSSYRHYAYALFGHRPDTPYGYYTEEFNALVMNVGTGAGTLIHELVHPYMRANFPNVPPWFNEGLASLYEASTTRNGHIWGVTNWRLRGLKREIRRGTLPSFQTLMSKNEETFYGDVDGDNYAQSRYLLQYLQERGLLHAYYHAFHAARKDDPTGYETLKAILDIDDVDAFQAQWARWVMALTFER